MNHTIDTIVCPKCKGELVTIENKINCLSCGQSYTKHGPIPSFVNDGLYWGEISKEIMQELLSASKIEGVYFALNKIIRNEYPDLYYYILDEKRVIPFITLLDLKNNCNAIDIGSGYGTVSLFLSKYFTKVYAVEPVKERAEFIQLISNERKRTNIEVIQASMHQLPFTDNTFDLIVLNGVLEWAGLELIHTNPRTVQSFLLINLLKLLKPTGTLLIAIENRISYRYFLGELDHSGLKYTSLLPRPLANLAFHFFKKRRKHLIYESNGYRTYTYSYWGYKQLLRRSGFAEVMIFGCYPSYYDPEVLFPFSSDFIHLISIPNNKNLSTKIFTSVMKIQLLKKCFTPAFVIVAKREI